MKPTQLRSDPIVLSFCGPRTETVTGIALRRWRTTMWLAASAYVGEGRLFLLDYALRGLRVMVLLAIWRSILEARPEASPMPLAMLLSYTVIAEVFAHPMSVQTTLSNALWQGTLVHYFLRPIGVVRQFAAEMTGQWAVDALLFSLPLFVIAGLSGIRVLPADPQAAVLFALSLGLAVSVGLALEFIFGAIALVLDEPIWLVENVRRALSATLSGAIVPLSLLPWGLGDVLAWLPFASMAWAPLAIYTGADAAPPLLLKQLLWSLVLWPLALGLWHWNREKVTSHGG